MAVIFLYGFTVNKDPDQQVILHAPSFILIGLRFYVVGCSIHLRLEHSKDGGQQASVIRCKVSAWRGGTMFIILLLWALNAEYFLDWCSHVDSLKLVIHDVLRNIRVLCFYITLSHKDGRARYVNVMTTSLPSLLHSLQWPHHGRSNVFLCSAFFVGKVLNT